MTATDSVTQLLPTALTSTRLIDMQRAEGEVVGGGLGKRREVKNSWRRQGSTKKSRQRMRQI